VTVRRLYTLTALACLAFLLWTHSPARAEVVQKAGVRLALSGAFTPRALPRSAAAPIAVEVGGTVSTVDGSPPPQLQTIEIEVNRAARLDPTGLPSCTYDQLQPSTTAGAMAACGPAKVGEGTFTANVAIPEQSPFPSDGKLVAFNGTEGGRPVIFAHVYGTEPIPTSYTLVLQISRGRGTWGTVLRASLPQVTASVAFVTGITLRLHRVYRAGGERRSYLSAACSAPAGLPGATFPLARATFSFADGLGLGETLVRSCRAAGG
jgi:hypothetical protein